MKARRERRVFAAALSVLIAFALAEAALHFAPGLLPASYLRRYPLQGAAFFDRDLLDRTPVRELPLPLRVGSYSGPGPRDLVARGMAPPRAALDRFRDDVVELTLDPLGFPNPSIPERAEIVFVGDSFAVTAGMEKPVGLQYSLAGALGRTIYNLGVAATGPHQHLWLLEQHGLPKEPEVVVWFLFGGNDTIDAARTLEHEAGGRLTYGAVHADREPPRLRLPSLLRFIVGHARARRALEPLPGLDVVDPPLPERRVWFLPSYLQLLARSRAQWEADAGWRETQDVLRRAHAAVEDAGVRFLVLYLPSKAQFLLPRVVPDAGLIHRMACFDRADAVASTPEVFLADALRHRLVLEELVGEFCVTEGIEFLSATPDLDAAAELLRPLYFDTDTHWTHHGQDAILATLARRVGE